MPIIADGGITYSGDIVKAIAAGADDGDARLAAGRHRRGARARLELFEGRRYKSYRGMGSLGAMQGLGADRYATAQSDAAGAASRKLVPEGIEGRVPYAGPLGDVVYQLVGGLRSGMGYAGAADLGKLRPDARFMRVTTAGREESHPHDVTITKEAPNYQRRLNYRRNDGPLPRSGGGIANGEKPGSGSSVPKQLRMRSARPGGSSSWHRRAITVRSSAWKSRAS